MKKGEGDAIRVLLVDDEVEFLQAVTPPLVRRGFVLTLAEDGAAALQLLTRRSYDAVVLDVKMPGISGVDLFYKIRSLCPELPVVLLTGHATVQDAFQTSRDGVFEYLTKPCEVDHLVQVLRAAVGRTARVPAAGRPPDAAPMEGARLLLGDTEQDFVAALSAVLERRGVQVSVVESTGAALSLLGAESFDVALVDSRLFGAPAASLVRWMTKSHSGLEVIVLTAQPSAEDAVESLRAGAFAFLSKPQPLDALLPRIAEAVASARARRSGEQRDQIERILDERPD